MDNIEIKKTKRVIPFLILILLSIILSACGAIVNEKYLKAVEEELQSNEELSEYFTYFGLMKDSTKDTIKHNGSSVSFYILSTHGNEKFSSLSDNDKLKKLNEVAEVLKEQYTLAFIDCGKKKYCDVTEIFAITSGEEAGKNDSYKMAFDRKNSSSDSMEVSYYDEDDRFNTRTVNSGYSNNNTNQLSATQTSSPLVIEETSCNKDGNYIYVDGYVKNNGNQKLSFIQVQAYYFDSSGNVVDTDYTYAVGSEGLEAGSRKSFSLMSRNNDSIKKCNYKITDYK